MIQLTNLPLLLPLTGPGQIDTLPWSLNSLGASLLPWDPQIHTSTLAGISLWKLCLIKLLHPYSRGNLTSSLGPSLFLEILHSAFGPSLGTSKSYLLPYPMNSERSLPYERSCLPLTSERAFLHLPYDQPCLPNLALPLAFPFTYAFCSPLCKFVARTRVCE